VSCEVIYGIVIFRILGGILSYPDELFHFKELIIFLTFFAVTGVNLILGKVLV
jgi:hypothetical protein